MHSETTTRAPPPTVAACQMAVADLDVAANLDAVCERVTDLAPNADLALFPEYALTGFVGDERIHDAALARDAPELGRLADLAAATDTALLVGFVEEAADESGGGREYYNAAAYLDPHSDRGDGEVGAETGTDAVETTVYRKRHLWGDEEALLEPGDERVTVETPVGTAALLTCFDLNFVGESAAFATPDVEALLVVGAWPAAHSQNWKLLLRARALDGVRWVVGAGRTGKKTVDGSREAVDGPTEYAGRSRVVRPDGSVQAGLNRGERDLVADLDPTVLAECREFIPVLDE
ncbi:carbon-nitrogen hydrolase family protein [Halorussus salinus]|uniref:carbon-nitrogen hydrolase family protein n=1 Tax=Halorussus salinus TaxID=1364935 RepID=UPI0034A5AD6D